MRREILAELVRERDTARFERDAARATIAELVTALTGLERRFLDPKTGDPGGSCWCDPHRYLELQGHEDECEVARAALAKAKGGEKGAPAISPAPSRP